MLISDISNKERVAIVAVGYNRLSSMRRLLQSLLNADYEHPNIPLVISIDASGDEVLYDYVQNFDWPYGEKYVNIQKERLGLRKHIIRCGDLTSFFRAVIVLEDDIFVSPFFYHYVEAVLDYYENDDRIGGFSLYQNEVSITHPIYFYKDGSDTYLKQSPASWGECWTKKQWDSFKEWYNQFDDSRFEKIDIPDFAKSWKKAWSKYYMAYLVETKRYFVFPHDTHTTCFSEVGENSGATSTIGQANLLCGKKEYHFKPFDQMVRYDIYMVNEAVYEWTGFSKEQLCIDWYGTSKNLKHRRYLLTTYKMPFKVVRCYGLQMRPIELNIKYDIEGNGLYIYDTEDGHASAIGLPAPFALQSYYFRTMDIKMGFKYVSKNIFIILKNKIRKIF